MLEAEVIIIKNTAMKITRLIIAAVCGVIGILLMLSEPAEDCTTYEWLQAFLGTRAIAAALIVVSYLSARGLHLLDHIDE